MLIIALTMLNNDSRSSYMSMKRLVELKLCCRIIYMNGGDDNINDIITSNISIRRIVVLTMTGPRVGGRSILL